MPSVSVVICCYNSSKRLPETLEHLMKQDAPNDLWELVVVDNASTDNTGEIAARCWTSPVPIRVVFEHRPGVGYARMTGLEEAAGEFVCFVDDDNWLSASWISTVVAIMADHPSIGVLGGRGKAVSEVPLPSWFRDFERAYAVGRQATFSGDVTDDIEALLWGAGMTVRRSAWQQIVLLGFRPLLGRGRMGTRFSVGEDTEIALALKLAGWRLWYDDRLVFEHFIPANKLRWRYLRGIYRGFGASDLLINAYREPASRFGDLDSKIDAALVWFKQVLPGFIRLAKRLLRSPWLIFGNKEGSQAALSSDFARAKLFTLVSRPIHLSRCHREISSFLKRLPNPRVDQNGPTLANVGPRK